MPDAREKPAGGRRQEKSPNAFRLHGNDGLNSSKLDSERDTTG